MKDSPNHVYIDNHQTGKKIKLLVFFYRLVSELETATNSCNLTLEVFTRSMEKCSLNVP